MERRVSPVKDFFYGTVLYNYLFIIFQLAYNYLIRDRLLDSSIKTVYEVRKAPWLGFIVLSAVVAGGYAIMIKCRIIRSRNPQSVGAGDFLIWILGWVITISMVFTAVQSFGIEVSKKDGVPSDFENTVIAISIFGAMIHLGAVLGFIMMLETPYAKYINRKQIIASDISAFIFLCISYTVVWETIMYSSVVKYGKYNIMTPYGIFNIIGWIICFILLYPPMRSPYILMEIHNSPDNRNSWGLFISYILVIITGILPLVKI